MPPRGGQPNPYFIIPRGGAVSSHAPARGATFRIWSRSQPKGVSSHAPARGATAEQPSPRPRHGSFKSCPREGGNYNLSRSDLQYLIVSSHAPARGATVLRGHQKPIESCFKSCPREGGNHRLAAPSPRFTLFQVMPPRGGQPISWKKAFASRLVSSHAPARGATFYLSGISR